MVPFTVRLPLEKVPRSRVVLPFTESWKVFRSNEILAETVRPAILRVVSSLGW